MKKVVIFLVVILMIPFGMTLLYSIFSYYKYPQLLPSGFTMEYWKNLFLYNPLVLQGIKNSLLIGLLNGIFSTAVGFMAARGMVKSGWVKSQKLTYLYTLPLFVPATALFIGVHLMMIKLNLANSYTAVILSHMLISVPYATNIGISYFQGIPEEMEQIAKTLGGGTWALLWKLYLPLLAPGLLFSTALCFLLSDSEFFGAFLMGGGKIITIATLLYPYINNADYGNSATLSVVFILLNLLVFFIADTINGYVTKKRKYLY